MLAVATLVALPGFLVFSSTESVTAIVLFVVFTAPQVLALLILFFITLAIVNQLALRELGLSREGIIGAIRYGLILFWRNLGRSLLVWIILLALAFGAGVVLFILALILGLAIFLPVAALISAEFTAVGIVLGVVGALITPVPFLILSGAIGAYGSSYWTLAYLRMTSAGTEPRPGLEA